MKFGRDLGESTREASEVVVRTQHALPVGSMPTQYVSDALLHLVSDGAAMISGTALAIKAAMSAQWSA